MTVKELKSLYDNLCKRMDNLDTHFTNHLSSHKWDRIVGYLQLILMVIVIPLLKFKIL